MATLFEGGGWKITNDEAPLPDGRMKKAVRAHRADAVNILAFTDENLLIMIHEYRPFYKEYIWMLPGGRVDKEVDIETGAQRELQEEAGYKAGVLKHLWTVDQSEALVLSNHFYLARDLVRDPLPQDAEELIEVHEMPIEEALKKVHSSPKVHLPSAYALMRYMNETTVSS